MSTNCLAGDILLLMLRLQALAILDIYDRHQLLTLDYYIEATPWMAEPGHPEYYPGCGGRFAISHFHHPAAADMGEGRVRACW